ncbi:thrombomodulin-like [Seriola dumerili]|uniref:thrombomodulin-like n=1 Tax=Seriola dumerili TaxID=41447 RepID=UPI000BBEF810|nr:thrombomodulin-like [Seriola dumerili]
MTPTTRALLLCAVFLCGLEEADLSRSGHCAGTQCLVLFREPMDFPGAQKRCKDEGGELSSVDLGQPQETLRSLLSGVSGSFWMESLNGTGVKTGEAASGPRICSFVLTGGPLMMSFRPCDEKLDGFLCRYSFEEPCGSLLASGGAQVSYNHTHWGFKVEDSETFPPGTTAVAEKIGAKYPDSRHVCFSGKWMPAPWNCEVMEGGCEYTCSSLTKTCMCPARQSLHHNNFTCTKDPCADCEQGCEQESDSFVCKCEKGYRLAKDSKSCLDVNECKEEDPCTGVGEECENTQGSFKCKCRDGFLEEDGMCVDVSICDKCEHMKCIKHDWIYRCECHEGFRVSPKNATLCEQHCTERDCPADCVVTRDEGKEMVQCRCPEGYITDVKNNITFCTDINECENERECDHNCENLFGGYRCSCDEGYELLKGHTCVPIETDDGSGSSTPQPTPAGASPAAVPPYIKTGSVLGITVFMLLCAVLLFCSVRYVAKRCGKFKLPSFQHPDLDIFYLQQVTTETYKRFSFDKQFKNDLQRQ